MENEEFKNVLSLAILRILNENYSLDGEELWNCGAITDDSVVCE